jgi:hypothetical protein
VSEHTPIRDWSRAARSEKYGDYTVGDARTACGLAGEILKEEDFAIS